MSLLAVPFLKWAGGKSKLTLGIDSKGAIPPRFDTYYEPFLGGGAVFWYLAWNHRFKHAVLNDSNKELMDCYRVVRDFPDDLLVALQNVEHEYNLDPKPTFERWKALVPAKLDPVGRAVRTILLNKTGFNGLFRLNRQGVFNVPWGKREKARLFSEETIRACSKTLNRGVTLLSMDFADMPLPEGPGDVMYFDPPYVPASRTANFTSYTDGKFTMDDQYRVAALFKQLADKGVHVIASNADTPEVRALYAGFELHEVRAARAINCDGAKRGKVGELIVVSRSPDATAPGTSPEAVASDPAA